MRKYLSHGMGVCSTALMLELLDRGEIFESVFANHGGDYPETYEYCDYLKDEGYNITVLDIKPTLYDHLIEHKTVPSIRWRWCTSNFKNKPLVKYMQEPCSVCIGYSYDERKRARIHKKGERYYKFPLILWGLRRVDCTDIIKDHGLKVPPKSGCYFCPFQSVRDWMELSRTHPDLFDKAVVLENNAPNMSLMWSHPGVNRMEDLDIRGMVDLDELFR